VTQRNDDETHDLQTPPTAIAARWRLHDRVLELAEPKIMAICNVTPDSFSDGGLHLAVDAALRFAERALRAGAAILDIGGESTRPGATPVIVGDELARVLPVVRAVRERLPELLISIDTVKSAVAAAALDQGAHIINDVSGGRLDGAMYSVVARADAGMVLMHSRGSVSDMASYAHATYSNDVMGDVCSELLHRRMLALSEGVRPDAIVFDPGAGFSKTSEQTLIVLRELSRLVSLGCPVMVGASRKRFIGELTGVTEPRDRATGGAVVHALAVAQGARLIRTHDVAITRDALAVASAI
jgi:dihydropteroate synthase